ncbi:MAG: Mut7-C RNAse domain-containing protein [Candidatus Zhuqueibacterota bacterium]
MKFIVDVMLGKLAKWLRILGYDTVYDPHFTDDDLFFRAHQERRILLTRDKQLSQRMNPDYTFFVTELLAPQQVKQVVEHFKLDTTHGIFTRCTLCNSPVTAIPKQTVQGKVPDYVFRTTDQFYFCPACEKIYWPGSHTKQVRDALKSLSAGT